MTPGSPGLSEVKTTDTGGIEPELELVLDAGDHYEKVHGRCR